MKYAVFKNVPLNQGILSRTNKNKVDWNKYGFTVDGLRLVHDLDNDCCGQGWTAQQVADEKKGDFLNIFPIMNQDKFDAQLAKMEAYCANSVNLSDSVECVSETKAKELFATIVAQAE